MAIKQKEHIDECCEIVCEEENGEYCVYLFFDGKEKEIVYCGQSDQDALNIYEGIVSCSE